MVGFREAKALGGWDLARLSIRTPAMQTSPGPDGKADITTRTANLIGRSFLMGADGHLVDSCRSDQGRGIDIHGTQDMIPHPLDRYVENNIR